MEFNIEKDKFTEILQLLVNIAPRSTNDPIINNVKIEADSETSNIRMSATDYEVAINGEISAEVLASGSICVAASRLYNLSRELFSNSIKIKSTEQNWVFITGGNSRIKLPGMDPGSFPPIVFEDLDQKISIQNQELRNSIDRTIFAIGENQARKNLMGLNFKIDGSDTIQWLGADGFRISRYTSKTAQEVGFSGDLIIPKRCLPEIRKILEYTGEGVEVSFDENVFQMFSGSIHFKSKLIEAEYPNLSGIIVDSAPYEIEAPRVELTNAVRLLSMVSDDKTSSMKMTFSENQLLLESEKLEFGEGNQTISARYSGSEPNLVVGFNIRFFLDALQSFDSSKAENLTMFTSGPSAPCMLKCAEWENYKTIIMPVRIKW